jgi:hypothetical protein
MRKKKKPIHALTKMFFIPALAVFLVSSGGYARALQKEEPIRADVRATQANPDSKAVPPAALTGITISFKLDPRLTRGLYMGDRWVSPPTYTRVGEGKELTVDASVRGLDAKGRPENIRPTWAPSDPDMVAVTPGQDNQVSITVKRAGESSLMVTYGKALKKLDIKAVRQNGGLRVDISQ